MAGRNGCRHTGRSAGATSRNERIAPRGGEAEVQRLQTHVALSVRDARPSADAGEPPDGVPGSDQRVPLAPAEREDSLGRRADGFRDERPGHRPAAAMERTDLLVLSGFRGRVPLWALLDRKSTRLNSSHLGISY